MIIERDIFEDNGEKASCGYDGGGAINQRWCAKNVRLDVIPGRRRYKKTIAGALPCVGPNPSYTAPTVGCGLCVLCDFARDMGAHIVLRASSRRRDHTAPRPSPRAALRFPEVRKRPPLRGYCGTQSGVAFAESCGLWQLSATLSAIASMVVCKCRQLGQQMPATQIADRLNPHIGGERKAAVGVWPV